MTKLKYITIPCLLIITIFFTFPLSGCSFKERDNYYKLTEEQQEAADKIDELKSSYEDFRNSKESALSQVSEEFQYYRDLLDELDSIVDSNGKIKAGYEDRAEVIVNKLREITGLDIEVNDGIVTSND